MTAGFQVPMHVVVIFNNIGGYHAARLRAFHVACQTRGWKLTAVQQVDHSNEHPWGELGPEITFPLRTLSYENPGGNSHTKLRSKLSLPRVLKSLKPDVLVVPGWGFRISLTGLLWCGHYRVPTIVMSESKMDDEKRKWWKETPKSWLVKRFDSALVGGKLHSDYLVELGFPPDRIFCGYDVVDNKFFESRSNIAREDPARTRRRQSMMPSRPYFLAVSRFIPRKNLAALIKAFGSYRRTIGFENAWDLVVCGSGPQEGLLREIVRVNSLERNVHFPGFVGYQHIGDWYGLAGAFIHPALREQWGLVVNEACAAGLPILGSIRAGACRELVQERVNGLLFDPESESQIADSLIAVHSATESERLRMGRMSSQIITRYSPKEFGLGLMQAVDCAVNHVMPASARSLQVR